MSKRIELLAPGGDINAIKTAILAGADAIYCGLNKFNARNRAANISFEELQGLLRIAHQNDCKVFLTLNIIIFDSEIPALIKLLNRLVNTSIDGVIIQDFGLFYLINKYFPSLSIHASTQLTTHNVGQISFLRHLNADRVNLSRELSLDEITALTHHAHQEDVEVEVFVHGSYCISFSGLCYMSAMQSGNSGNRGQCSQPCRDRFVATKAGKSYPLNLKDNSAYLSYESLYNAGVDSLKIEGRIKESEYVYTTVSTWRQQIDHYHQEGKTLDNINELYKVFNRDFSDAYLRGTISKDMFIDNPMNHSIAHLKAQHIHKGEEYSEKELEYRINEKASLRDGIESKIAQYDSNKLALDISVIGKKSKPLIVILTSSHLSFEVHSASELKSSGNEMLTASILLKRLKAIDDTEFYIDNINFQLEDELYLPFKELTDIKKQILFRLNGGRKYIPPVNIPRHKKRSIVDGNTSICIFITEENDLDELLDFEGEIFFKLPNQIGRHLDKYVALFNKHKQLIPYFPSILIGEDYMMATRLFDTIAPNTILSDNTGIAHHAYLNGVKWIAGPHLNISNSFSLQCLQESFNCSGAFLSIELSKQQLLPIRKPEDFKLYHSIYQPLSLMVSRQCFFHQVSGCHKNIIDESCIEKCQKTATIQHHKGDTFIIKKNKGHYHHIYSDKTLLNLEIAHDMGARFSALAIDLSHKTDSTKLTKQALIALFQSHIKGDIKATELISSELPYSTNRAYEKGI